MIKYDWCKFNGMIIKNKNMVKKQNCAIWI